MSAQTKGELEKEEVVGRIAQQELVQGVKMDKVLVSGEIGSNT